MRRSIYGATLFLMFTLVAYGQSASSDSAQDHKDAIQNARHDLNQDVKEVREGHQEQQAARTEQKDVNQDKAALRQDVKDGDKAAARQEQKDARQAERDMQKDVAKAKQDERDARQDVRDAHQEQQKLSQMRNAAAGGGRGRR
jgi:chromosome segregation ATPase